MSMSCARFAEKSARLSARRTGPLTRCPPDARTIRGKRRSVLIGPSIATILAMAVLRGSSSQLWPAAAGQRSPHPESAPVPTRLPVRPGTRSARCEAARSTNPSRVGRARTFGHPRRHVSRRRRGGVLYLGSVGEPTLPLVCAGVRRVRPVQRMQPPAVRSTTVTNTPLTAAVNCCTK
jgi:hypothetical protein